MGLRFVQTYTENGDILDGLGWVLDNAEFAGEVNGSLDRDNLPANTIARAEIVDNTFTETLYVSQNAAFTPSITTTEWQGKGSGVDGIFSYSFDADEDCVITVETFANWAWASFTESYDVADTTCNTIQMRISLDGQPIALSERHDDTRYQDHLMLLGIAVINAGNHVLRVDCRVARVGCTNETVDGVVTDTPTIGVRGLLVTQEKR